MARGAALGMPPSSQAVTGSVANPQKAGRTARTRRRHSRGRKCPHFPAHSGNVKANCAPTCDRALTPREGARLQSFDDDFEFVGNRSQIVKQIGNAVPPLLGRAIGEALTPVLGA